MHSNDASSRIMNFFVTYDSVNSKSYSAYEMILTNFRYCQRECDSFINLYQNYLSKIPLKVAEGFKVIISFQIGWYTCIIGVVSIQMALWLFT